MEEKKPTTPGKETSERPNSLYNIISGQLQSLLVGIQYLQRIQRLEKMIRDYPEIYKIPDFRHALEDLGLNINIPDLMIRSAWPGLLEQIKREWPNDKYTRSMLAQNNPPES